MIKFIKNFRKDEAGAVTVDWVVLTAAVVGLGVAAFTAVETSTSGLTTEMTTAIGAADVHHDWRLIDSALAGATSAPRNTPERAAHPRGSFCEVGHTSNYSHRVKFRRNPAQLSPSLPDTFPYGREG
ncbi:MAG: hypothetical protein R3D81_12655 [Thalassovita sp.]